MLKEDFHVHLYGCLTPENLWDIGKDRYKSQNESLKWYANEYEKAWGRRPNFTDYWESDDGFEYLKKDFLFANRACFNRFQANFNLIIALCPISPEGFDIQEMIIRNVARHGLKYFEARTIIPLHFTESQIKKYLNGLCSLVNKLNDQLEMQTRLVFSLFRDNRIAEASYTHLRKFIRQNPRKASVISGIDFAFGEIGFPPKTKIKLFSKLHADNSNEEQKLDLLYHVGESFEDKGLISAIRWVWEAHHLGASRLGHAIALGVDPENYKGKIVNESVSERKDTLDWLIKNSSSLKEHGFSTNLQSMRAERQKLQNLKSQTVEVKYDREYIEEARALQYAVASMLKLSGLRIESCPTSNLRIGGIQDLRFHPLRAFHNIGIDYIICTDDPGVFGIDWITESKLAKKISQL